MGRACAAQRTVVVRVAGHGPDGYVWGASNARIVVNAQRQREQCPQWYYRQLGTSTNASVRWSLSGSR
jgi:hypothetical protein